MRLPGDYTRTEPAGVRHRPGVPAMQFALSSFEDTLRFENALVERMTDWMAGGGPERA